MRLGIEAGAHTLDVAVEHGIKGVPVSAERLVSLGLEAALAPLRERGLSICQIGAFGFNPLSPDKARQAEQRRILETAIPLTAQTGCPYLVICGGNYDVAAFARADQRNFTNEALDEIAHELEPLLHMAELHGAKIAIELYLKTAVNSAERFLALWERLRSDALCANVDVTSLYTYADIWDPLPLARRTCELLAGHYGLVHIKDVALQDGFHIHIDLAPIGAGVTDWQALLPFFESHIPEDSWAILEHVKTPAEARLSLENLRAAAQAAGIRLA
ncbi:MAG: sugar phosphate isomerase/epimerase [Chloroflexi bacterium]|nr:sugar phosphate isomerase/epimerase [Chloroflexota bacterium]